MRHGGLNKKGGVQACSAFHRQVPHPGGLANSERSKSPISAIIPPLLRQQALHRYTQKWEVAEGHRESSCTVPGQNIKWDKTLVASANVENQWGEYISRWGHFLNKKLLDADSRKTTLSFLSDSAVASAFSWSTRVQAWDQWRASAVTQAWRGEREPGEAGGGRTAARVENTSLQAQIDVPKQNITYHDKTCPIHSRAACRRWVT